MSLQKLLKGLFSPEDKENEVIAQLAAMGLFAADAAPLGAAVQLGDASRWKYVLYSKYYEGYDERSGNSIAAPISRFAQFLGAYFKHLFAHANQNVALGASAQPSTLRVDDRHIVSVLSPFDRDYFSIKSIVNAHPSQYVLKTEDLSFLQRLNNMLPAIFSSAPSSVGGSGRVAECVGGNIRMGDKLDYKLYIKYFVRAVLIDFFNVRASILVRQPSKRIVDVKFGSDADYASFLKMYETQIEKRGKGEVDGMFARLYARLTGANFFDALYERSLNILTWFMCFFNHDRLRRFGDGSFKRAVEAMDSGMRMEFSLKMSAILLDELKKSRKNQPNVHFDNPAMLLLLLESMASNQTIKGYADLPFASSIAAEPVDYLKDDPLQWSLNSEAEKNSREFDALPVNRDIYNKIAEQSSLVQRMFQLCQSLFIKLENKLKDSTDYQALDSFAKDLFTKLEPCLEHSKNRLFFKKYFGFSNSIRLYPFTSLHSMRENSDQMQLYIHTAFVEFGSRTVELPRFVADLIPQNLWTDYLGGQAMPLDSFDLSPLPLSAEVLAMSRLEEAPRRELEELNPLYIRNDLKRNERGDLVYKNEDGEEVVVNDDLKKMTPERLKKLHYTFQIEGDDDDQVAYALYRAAVAKRDRDATLAALKDIEDFKAGRMHRVHPKFALNVLQALGFHQVREKGQRFYLIEEFSNWMLRQELPDDALDADSRRYIEALIRYVNANPIILNRDFEVRKRFTNSYPVARKMKALTVQRPIRMLSTLFDLQARRRNALQYLKMQGGDLYAHMRVGLPMEIRGGAELLERGPNRSSVLVGSVGSHIQLPYVAKRREDLDVYAEVFKYFMDKMQQMNVSLDEKTYNEVVEMINTLKQNELELQRALQTLETALFVIAADPAALSAAGSNKLNFKSLSKIVQHCNGMHSTCNRQTAVLNEVFRSLASTVERATPGTESLQINDALGGY